MSSKGGRVNSQPKAETEKTRTIHTIHTKLQPNSNSINNYNYNVVVERSSTKHIQLCEKYMKSNTNNNNNNIYSKVLCQKDYLTIVCEYLRICDIFYSIPLISTYHINYLNNIINNYNNNKQSLNMIKKCLYYDFGNILNIFKIKLENDHKNNNNNEQQ